ncbi:MAG TPA: SDR family oxidoreductase [Aggregatilineales bacterium]|nr:SDR family oxidoreductase [Anaerolineales bacterium]HRE47998.1 SDR family oxidoreductase [Aggregatilineales bacterium]
MTANTEKLIHSMLDLSGKTALITGASRGIGAATAELLGAAGANLILCSRNIDVKSTTARYEDRYGRKPIVAQADVGDAAAFWHILESARDRFGGIDILVNNAAMNATGDLLETEEEAWLNVLKVNLIGISRLCNLIVPDMMAKKWGRIINISSNLGQFALKGKGVYSAAKAGLIQLTRNMALEWASYGILVNDIAAGAINTDMSAASEGSFVRDYSQIARSILVGRLGDPTEIAQVVLFLASPMSTYITGQSIVVDGGASIWFAH